MWWHTGAYEDLNEIEESGVKLYYRWDECRREGKLLTRYLTAYTPSTMVFTMNEAEAEGRLRLKFIELEEELTFNENWRQVGAADIAKLKAHKPTLYERLLFTLLRLGSSRYGRESLTDVHELLSSVVWLKRHAAGHNIWNPTDDEKLEMSYYEALNSKKECKRQAAEHLLAMANQRGKADISVAEHLVRLAEDEELLTSE